MLKIVPTWVIPQKTQKFKSICVLLEIKYNIVGSSTFWHNQVQLRKSNLLIIEVYVLLHVSPSTVRSYPGLQPQA